MLRILFMGTPELAASSLRALIAAPGIQVIAVVTQPDQPKGRGLHLQPSPVKRVAQQAGLPILQPHRAREQSFIEELRALQPDLIAVAAYGQILPQAVLDLPRFGCLNVHTSLLPRYRGAAPIQHAILNGDPETGVTIMKMDAGLDTGGILTQEKTSIAPSDNSQMLHDRLADLGAHLLVSTIPDFISGKIQPHPQPAEGVTHAPKIKKQDGRIDWKQPARVIWNRVRAMVPWPGAFTHLPDQPQPHLVKIWEAQVVELNHSTDIPPRRPAVGGMNGQPAESPSHAGTGSPSPPRSGGEGWGEEVVKAPGEAGCVLQADKNGIVIACGSGALRIIALQREGGRRMSAAEFLAGHALIPGQKLQ